jgi:hypothetical protein
MKSSLIKHWLQAGVACLIFTPGLAICQPLTVTMVDSFANNVNGWSMQGWNGTPNATCTWAAGPTYDAGQSASSGSMELQIPFNNTGYNGSTALYSPSVSDFSACTAFAFDVKVDPNSWLDGAGDAVQLQPGLSWNNKGFIFYIAPVATNNGWQHISMPASDFAAGTFTNVTEIEFQTMDYDTPFASNGTAIIYIDNIEFTAPSPTYPNYNPPAFQFNDPSTTAEIYGTGTPDLWYGGNNASFTWSSTLDTLDPSSTGSLYVSCQFDGANNGESCVCAIPFDTNWVGGNTGQFTVETNPAYIIDARQYSAIELDVMWDSVNSTVPLDDFNAAGDIHGFPMGALENGPIPNPTGGGVQSEICGVGASNIYIPDAASNGWVHMVIPITYATIEDSQVIGIWMKKYYGGPDNGTVAFWVDNITYDGAVIPTVKPQASLSLSKPVDGLQLNFDGYGPYDREGVATWDNSYSFVTASGPVTYSMTIGYAPPPAYPSGLRIYLDPMSGTSSSPDWNDANILSINLNNNATGPLLTLECKTNEANSNGDLYDASDPTWAPSNSPTVGTWSFTISNNTNIYCLAPDGESTNLPFPLSLTSAQVASFFDQGNGMWVYYSAECGGTTGEGSRWVLTKASISGGGVPALSDNFVTDANNGDPGPASVGQGNEWTSYSGVDWANEANSSALYATYLIGTNTVYFLDWTDNTTNSYTVMTNTTPGPSGWGSNTVLTGESYLNASSFRVEVANTNLPPTGNLFFELMAP